MTLQFKRLKMIIKSTVKQTPKLKYTLYLVNFYCSLQKISTYLNIHKPKCYLQKN